MILSEDIPVLPLPVLQENMNKEYNFQVAAYSAPFQRFFLDFSFVVFF
jgi:hypothetical protein